MKFRLQKALKNMSAQCHKNNFNFYVLHRNIVLMWVSVIREARYPHITTLDVLNSTYSFYCENIGQIVLCVTGSTS